MKIHIKWQLPVVKNLTTWILVSALNVCLHLTVFTSLLISPTISFVYLFPRVVSLHGST